MSNLEKYKKVFLDSFGIKEEQLNAELEYNTIPTWDSVGHMGMVAKLEETFEIEMDIDDIIDFSSYEKGFELLKKYEVEV
jgi:acyl carrier protein